VSETLAAREWRDRQRRHEERVDGWLLPHLERRQRGETHPVEDFLFTYYSHRPSALRRWHPGIGVTLTGAEVGELAGRPGYVVEAEAAYVDPALVVERADRTRWVRDLLAATSSRPPQLGCFGLHEWAMVYQQGADDLRHSAYPLRLGPAGTDEVVESHRIACTHFDAFRFFTGPARPRNALQPTREDQQRNEQPGCLHAAMDLYKWSYKLTPLVPSELVADCFALAREVRYVDMQAAPYDLSTLGVEPIRIETQEGKARYIERQRDFAERGGVLRQRLVDVCDAALQHRAEPASSSRARARVEA
jgi:hypothetical protein